MKKIVILNLKIIYFAFFLVLLTSIYSCRNEEIIPEEESDEIEETEENTIIPGEGLADWSEETHGNSTLPNYDIVFNQSEVLRFDITISSDNWELMQDDLDDNLGSSGGRPGGPPGGGTTLSDFNPIWVPCSVNFDDTEWYNVGIRFKGNSSLSSTYTSGIKKFSFKLDFDEFENNYPEIKGQRFYGFKQLNLKNNFDDVSLIREKVGSDLFLDFGLAGPQTTFCVLYVDFGSGPVYFGVYTLVEEVDDTVLDNQFGESTGNLYKPDGAAASFAEGTYNDSQMEKKNNEELNDYSDVYDIYSIINSSDRNSDLELWKTNLNEVFDVDVFLKWLAANTSMQNWDTYGLMTHNYYLYNYSVTGKITWIPWDNNEALQDGKQGGAISMSLGEVSNYWPLIRYLADDEQYYERYKLFMLDFFEEVFEPERMNAIYDQYYDLLKDYAYAESSPYSFLYSDASFDAGIEQLKNHVSDRNAAMNSFLNF